MFKKISDFNSSDEYLDYYNQTKEDFSSVYEMNCYLASMRHTKDFVSDMGDEICDSLYQTLIEYGNVEYFLKQIQHEYLIRHDRII
jgi:hypothetical protein